MGLAVTIAKCFFMYTTIRLGLKLSLFQQFLTKVKHEHIKWYQRLGIKHYKIKSMLGNANRL